MQHPILVLEDPRYSFAKRKGGRWAVIDNFVKRPAWVDLKRMDFLTDEALAECVGTLNRLYLEGTVDLQKKRPHP